MKQTFEFFSVNTDTWNNEKIIDTITSATINIDGDSDTIYSATIASTESLGEQYVRIYLVATQDGITERFPLGTFLVQTPSSKFNGRVHDISVDAYSPLLELKDTKPSVGFTLLKTDKRNRSILKMAYDHCYEIVRAPIVEPNNEGDLDSHFTADPSEDWLSFLSALLATAKYKFSLDEMGKIMFAPIQEASAITPRFTYADDKVSILQPEITIEKDLYGIPNTVEVIYQKSSGSNVYSKVVNDDPSSIVSTVSRGREILYRELNPDLPGTPSQSVLDDYAKTLLKKLSAIEGTISYKHGYCPVRVGDCVYINYSRAGIYNLRAVVKSQSIECKTGCQVSETAVFTDNLWGD
jgi:hypothetical protein